MLKKTCACGCKDDMTNQSFERSERVEAMERMCTQEQVSMACSANVHFSPYCQVLSFKRIFLGYLFPP